MTWRHDDAGTAKAYAALELLEGEEELLGEQLGGKDCKILVPFL